MSDLDKVTATVWCGEMVECAKAFTDLCYLHRVARERDNAIMQLDAVDNHLPWKGTGLGRVETILALQASQGTL